MTAPTTLPDLKRLPPLPLSARPSQSSTNSLHETPIDNPYTNTAIHGSLPIRLPPATSQPHLNHYPPATSMRLESPQVGVGDNDAGTTASARPSFFAGCFALCYADVFDDISHGGDGEAPGTSSRGESGAGGIVEGLQDVRARIWEEMRQDRWNMEREATDNQQHAAGQRATGLRTRPSFDEHYAMRMRRGLSIVQEDFEEDENGDVQFRTSTPVRAQSRSPKPGDRTNNTRHSTSTNGHTFPNVTPPATPSPSRSSIRTHKRSPATVGIPDAVSHRPERHAGTAATASESLSNLCYLTSGPSTSNAMPPRLPPLAFLSSPSRKQPHTLGGKQIGLGGEEDEKME